jgi:hypothetical protein
MSGSPISRRDFLKLVGFGAVALGLGVFVKLGSLKELNRFFSRSAFAQSAGSWAFGPDTTVVAIHAAILPSNKIFYLAGSGYQIDHKNGPFESGVLDLATGSQQTSQQSVDLFCGGLAGLPNGNVLIAGGTKIYDTDINNCNGLMHGLEAAYEVNGASGAATPVSSMAHGRWYPTCVTLADGKVLVVNGYDEYGIYNLLTEIYDPSSGSWSQSYDPNSDLTYTVGASQETSCPGAGSTTYGGPRNGVAPNVGVYPKMHLMPSGLVITCGPTATVRSWNPATGIWNLVTQTSSYRDYGTSFLLPLNNTASERGKIMIVGGDRIATEPALSTVEILDFNAGSSTNPIVRTVASISHARKFLLPIILPNGKCAIFAGFAPDQGGETGNYTNIPEMFDPVTETWSSLPAASVDRGYHGVALLLPDGRIWTASDTHSRTLFELRTELFSPDYYSQTRPVISGTPNVGNYGGTIGIPTPDAPNITKVSLVRLMASTHHYDPNARLLWLQILSSNSNSVTVSAPLNSNLAPPGYYMIHVLNSSGIPSVAKIIKIPGSGSGDITAPAQVAGLIVTPVSSSQLNLDWTANTEPDLNHYNVYRGMSAGFSVIPGTTVPTSTPTTNSFSDTGLTASTTYYYRVTAVDNSGNIGSLSVEQSGTTNPPSDTTPPTVTSTDPANGAINVPLTKWARATFSEPMLSSSITTSTFTLKVSGSSTNVPGAVWLNTEANSMNAYFAPSSNLSPGTTYIATVTTGVKDLAGNAMTTAKSWSFTTTSDTTPPTVTSTDPANGAINVPLTKWTRATFSEPMLSSSITTSTFTLKVSGSSTNIPGVVWLNTESNSMNAYFAPSSNLSPGTTYIATVTTGVKDLAGNAMTTAKSWSFTTTSDTTPPTVTSTDPANGAINVPLTKWARATFSEPMLSSSITTSTFSLKVSGSSTNVPGVVWLNTESNSMNAYFAPSSNLSPGTTYVATVTTGVKDLAGNAMTTAKSWSFTSGAL